MATFSVNTDSNITSIKAKAGNDTYNINGVTLTIDSDSRVGPNATQTTGAFGAITISSALGGKLSITGHNVKLIEFSGGNGVIPVTGTYLNQDGVSFELLAVMTSRTGDAIIPSGSNYPDAGWMKVRNLNGTLHTGFISDNTFNIHRDAETGWMVVVGAQDKSFTVPKLGECVIDGDWFTVGSTNGVAGQTLNLPYFTADNSIDYPGVEIETEPGSGVYAFWANAANRFTSVNCSTDSRSRFVDISSKGVMTVGMGRDGIVAGLVPTSGCNIRIPNIILQTAGTSSLGTNMATTLNMTVRYESFLANSGRLTIGRATGAWYWNIMQAYSVYIRDLHTCDQIVFQEVATALNIDGLHVGLSNNSAAAYQLNSIVFQLLYNGGALANISAVKSDLTSSFGYAIMATSVFGGFTFNNVRVGCIGVPTSASGSFIISTSDDVTIDGVHSFAKRVAISGSNRVSLKNLYYADKCVGVTNATAACSSVEILNQSSDVNVGYLFNWEGVNNTHAYNAITAVSSSKRISIRNIGSIDHPYNAGDDLASGYLMLDSGGNDTIKLQRNWVTNLRLGLIGAVNNTKNLLAVNNYNVDGSKTLAPLELESMTHGNRGNGGAVPNSYTSVYGSSMWDSFTSDTTTKAALIFAEKTPKTDNLYVINSGTPVFNSAGSILLQNVGDSVTWTWGWRILGWTGLASMGTQAANLANHTVEYDIDVKNGFTGVFRALTNASLLAETGIDPVIGFKLRIRITANTKATSNKFDSLWINGTTTLALQNSALYPLDYVSLTVTGALVGSSISVLPLSHPDGMLPVTSSTVSGTSTSLSYEYDDKVTNYVLRIRKAGYVPIDLTYVNNTSVSIPVSQQLMADGFGVPIFGRGTLTTMLSVAPDVLRIDISNMRLHAEDVFDYMTKWQATATGMLYPEALRFDGTDLLLLNNWLFRRDATTSTSAGIDALPVVNGKPNASPDDEVNGSVDFRARSVRTYQVVSQPTYILDDIAAAVWAHKQSNGYAADDNLARTKTIAENALAMIVAM